MKERRQVPRPRMLRGARVVFNNGNSTIECIVRNLTDNGALLHFASIIGVPDAFKLVFDDGRAPRECLVDHRHPAALGVRFTGEDKPPLAPA
jgi:hypothetical protein